MYPIVYLDALIVKIRESGHVRNRAVYVAIGVNMQGSKEVLGLWAGQAEGSKSWLQVLTESKNRGVADVFIACVDGLKGFPEAIEAVFPQALVQLCIVHLTRASLSFVNRKERKAVAADLRAIYRAETAAKAEQATLRSTRMQMEGHRGDDFGRRTVASWTSLPVMRRST